MLNVPSGVPALPVGVLRMSKDELRETLAGCSTFPDKGWSCPIEPSVNTKQTFGVFNNHFRGYAPENCIQVMKMLGLANEKHETALKRIENHIEGRGTQGNNQEMTLDRFTGT
jgi:hypothetical protein